MKRSRCRHVGLISTFVPGGGGETGFVAFELWCKQSGNKGPQRGGPPASPRAGLLSVVDSDQA